MWMGVLLTATLLDHLEVGLLAFPGEAMVLLLLLHLLWELVSLQEAPRVPDEEISS